MAVVALRDLRGARAFDARGEGGRLAPFALLYTEPLHGSTPWRARWKPVAMKHLFPAPSPLVQPVRRVGQTIAATLLLAAPLAQAQDAGPVSADPEFFQIRPGQDQIPGVVTPLHGAEKNTVHVNTTFQYELNPVTGYRLDEFYANIVVNRIQAHMGVAWDFAKWGTWRLTVPWAVNIGTQIPELKAVGIGFSDISTGVTLTPVQTRFVNLGFHGDLWLPSGAKDAYMGERNVRASGGASLLVDVLDVVDVVADASFLGRRYLNTGQDFQLGSEFQVSEGVRIKLPWLQRERFGVQFVQALVAKGGFPAFFKGGAENGVEIVGGVSMPIRDIAFKTNMSVDVLAGRGTNQGYGTTDLRLLAGLTFTRNPGRPERKEIVEIEEVPVVVPPPIEELVELPPPPPPPEEVRVFKTEDEIVIRDPIEFFVNTWDIKPESLPTLSAVADIINEDYRIKHVVIEGHASAEGDFDHNYELSKNRAESIFKQLILDGVSPDRISYKGYGEVKPKVEGDTEEAYAVNRRVEFHVVGQFRTEDPKAPASYGTSTKLPWNGESVKVTSPPDWRAIKAKADADAAAKKKAEERRQNFEENDEIVPVAPKPAPVPPPAERRRPTSDEPAPDFSEREPSEPSESADAPPVEPTP